MICLEKEINPDRQKGVIFSNLVFKNMAMKNTERKFFFAYLESFFGVKCINNHHKKVCIYFTSGSGIVHIYD